MDSITINNMNYTKNMETFLIKQIEVELEQFVLGVCAVDPKANVSLNGYILKKIDTVCGVINIKIPRLRNYNFNPKLFKSKTAIDLLNNLCVSLYGNGLSTRRISSVIKDVFEVFICKSKVSDICKILDELVHDYFNKDISKYKFEIIQIDGKYFRVESVNKHRKAVLMSAIGITIDGTRKHIHMEVIPSEDSKYIEQFMVKLKNKINSDVKCFVVDGNINLSNTINKVFLDTPVQRCLVHVVRSLKKNLTNIADVRDKKTIEKQLNDIFFKTPNVKIPNAIKEFLNEWSKYYNVIKATLKDENIWSFLKLNVFADCKTNNVIEGFHSQLQTVTVNHKLYPNESSLYRAIISEINRYNELNSTCDKDNIASESFDIDDIFENIVQIDNIKIKIIYNGRIRIHENITSEVCKEIQKIVKSG